LTPKQLKVDNKGLNESNKSIGINLSYGTVESFDILYQLHFDALVHYATSILGSGFYSSDIVQDVFLKFWNLTSEKVDVRNTESLLFTMTRNLCLDRLRSLKTDKKVMANLAQKISSASITEDMLEDLEYQRLLQEAINSLSPQRKKVFILIRIEGLKRQEAARAMGISKETVKEAMRQALKSIRSYVCQKTGIKNREYKKASLKIADNIWVKELGRKVA
jgi:RNA polymerase sigma-70 factor (family 1)